MSTTRTAVEDEFAAQQECWCCGRSDDPKLMVHLGNHPEVTLCRPCARWAAKQAWQIDDRSKTGPVVIARRRLRNLRQVVVDREWHRRRIVGGPLRWIGNRLP